MNSVNNILSWLIRLLHTVLDNLTDSMERMIHWTCHFLSSLLTWILAIFYQPMNSFLDMILSPAYSLPLWISLTGYSILTGIIVLLVFKYTSKQQRIHQVKGQIKANILALKLFRDQPWVALRSQSQIMYGGIKLFRYSFPPLLIMALPATFFLAHLQRWYGWQPLEPGQNILLTIYTSNDTDPHLINSARLNTNRNLRVSAGPVRIPDKRCVIWKISANQPGLYHIGINVNGDIIDKEFLVGEQRAPVSPVRPPRHWWPMLMFPGEKVLLPNDSIQKICLNYRERSVMFIGGNGWLIYLTIVSMISALICKPIFRIRF